MIFLFLYYDFVYFPNRLFVTISNLFRIKEKFILTPIYDLSTGRGVVMNTQSFNLIVTIWSLFFEKFREVLKPIVLCTLCSGYWFKYLCRYKQLEPRSLLRLAMIVLNSGFGLIGYWPTRDRIDAPCCFVLYGLWQTKKFLYHMIFIFFCVTFFSCDEQDLSHIHCIASCYMVLF